MTIRSSGALPFTEIENEFSDTAAAQFVRILCWW